jgi:Integrase core domain
VSFPEVNATLLVIVDYYSRYMNAMEMKSTDGWHTNKALKTEFDTWGNPEVIRADNGPPFNSKEFKEACNDRNIQVENTIPLWPQMNGEVERQNRGIRRVMQIAKVEKRPWREALKEYIHAYNIRPHTVTQKAPLELMTGRTVRDLLPTKESQSTKLNEDIRERDAVEKLKGKLYSDTKRHAHLTNIEVGDKVMMKNRVQGKTQPTFDPKPFHVFEKNGSEAKIRDADGVSYRRNVSHLKKWPQPTEPDLNESLQLLSDIHGSPSLPITEDADLGEPASASCSRARRPTKVTKRYIEECDHLEFE